jgi:hypothetical protein
MAIKTFVGENGYLMIHHKSKRVRLHRYVWEQHYGAIPCNHVIHHINSDKTDNRIENLECMHVDDHWKLHVKMRYGKVN